MNKLKYVSTIIFEYIKNCIGIILGLNQTLHIIGLGVMFLAHEIGEFLFDFDVQKFVDHTYPKQIIL